MIIQQHKQYRNQTISILFFAEILTQKNFQKRLLLTLKCQKTLQPQCDSSQFQKRSNANVKDTSNKFAIQNFNLFIIYIIYIRRSANMQYFDMEKMNSIITAVQAIPNHPQLVQRIIFQYKLQGIAELAQVRQLAVKINTRMKRTLQAHQQNVEGESFRKNWVLREFKLFKTVLVLYSIFHSLQISHMKSKHLYELAQIFIGKDRTLVEYQVASIAERYNRTLSQWSDEESNLLAGILKTIDEPNWKEVAIELYSLSDAKFFRQFSECREHWNNHLNPVVSKANWTLAEDIRLLELIQEHGFRWSAVSKAMNGARNEHMVKNRYHSFLKQLKASKIENKRGRNPSKIKDELMEAFKRINARHRCPKINQQEATEEKISEVMVMVAGLQKQDESQTEPTELSKQKEIEKIDVGVEADEFSIEKYLSLDEHQFF